MKKLLFIFLIIFSTQTLAEGIAGKVLLCEYKNSPKYNVGIHFINDKTYHRYSIRGYDVARISGKYTLSLEYIYLYRWNSDGESVFENLINRASLSYDKYTDCKIVNSLDDIKENMYQTINKFKSKNKL